MNPYTLKYSAREVVVNRLGKRSTSSLDLPCKLKREIEVIIREKHYRPLYHKVLVELTSQKVYISWRARFWLNYSETNEDLVPQHIERSFRHPYCYSDSDLVE